MDVFCDAREVMRRYERYVIDLRRLFTFHGLTCGAAENFGDLAVKLEESRALRLDLPALLRNIRDLEGEQITGDEMLTAVALASGGEELVDGRAGSAGLMRTVGLLQMMLAGVGTWAETSGDERAAKAVTSESSTGEERVFLELAIEELRLQLGAVSRRMRELEPQILSAGTVGGEADASGEGTSLRDDRFEADRNGYATEAAGSGEVEDFGRDADLYVDADLYGVTPQEQTRTEPLRVAAGDRALAEREQLEREASEREAAAEMEAAARAMAERDAAVQRQLEEQARAEQARAARAAAEARAAEEALLERDRVRAWPLEERVSSLPAFSAKSVKTAKDLRWEQAQSEGGRRQRMMRLGGVAAGLLLATVGIYGSLRSASARADKESPRKEASRGAVAAPRAVPDAGLTNAGAGGDEARVTPSPAAERMAAKEAPRRPEAARVTEPSHLAEAREAPREAVAKVALPKEAAGIAPGVAAKNRRDDAAVEAALAERPAGGKFLFVPAEVMETHLVSARKPVVPAAAKGGPARVVLNAFIAKDGTVSRTDVVEGPPELINSAMAAVSWRRYRPFLVHGEPAAVVTPVVVSYGAK